MNNVWSLTITFPHMEKGSVNILQNVCFYVPEMEQFLKRCNGWATFHFWV